MRSRQLVSIVICAALFGAASLPYVANLLSQGIIGSDTFRYLGVAKSWLDGEISPTNWWAGYRPTAYALHTLGLLIFGFADYSIKIVHVITAALSVAIVVSVLRTMGASLAAAVSAGLALAVTPAFVLFSRIELVHVPAALFLLLSFLCYVRFHHYAAAADDRKAMLWVLACGVASSLAWGTHPSLILIAAPFGVLIVISRNVLRTPNVGWTAIHLAVYALGYFSVLMASTPWLGAIIADFVARTSTPLTSTSFLATVGELVGNLSYFPSGIVVAMFILSSVAGALFMVARPNRDIVGLAPIIFVSVYLLLFAAFTALGMTVTNVRSDLVRMMLPFVPLVFIGMFYWFDWIARRLLSKGMMVGPVLLVLYLGMVPSLPYFSTSFESIGSAWELARGKQTEYRAAWDVLGSKVTPTSRLLIAGSLSSIHTRGYMQDVYFGDKVSYLFDCDEDDLAAFLDRNRIRWIYVSGHLDMRILRTPERYERYDPQKKTWSRGSKSVGRCLGFGVGEFDQEQEMQRLVKFFESEGAKKIAEVQGRPLFERMPRSAPMN
jgi:hypothetical protein